MAGGLVFFTQPPGERLIARELEKQVAAITRRRVHIGRLETNLLSRLRIDDLAIYQSADDTSLILHLGQGWANYQLNRIFSGLIIISSLELHDLSVSIRRDSTGELNLPAFPAIAKKDSKSKRPLIRPQVGHIALRNGSIAFNDLTGKLPDAFLGRLELEADLEKGSGYRYELQMDTCALAYQTQVLSIEEVWLMGSLTEETLRLDTLLCALPGMTLAGEADLVHSDKKLPLQGDFRLEGDPGPVLDLARPFLPDRLFPVRGDLDLQVKLAGSVNNPDLFLQLRSPSIQFSDLRLGDIALDASCSDRTCSIDQFSLQVFGGQIGLTGSLRLDSLYGFQVGSRLSQIDLVSVWRNLYGKASPYQGLLEGALTAQGDLRRLRQTSLNANINLSNVKYRGKRIEDFSAGIKVKGGMATFHFEGEGAGSTGEIKLIGYRLNGRFSAHLDQLGPTVGFFNIPGFSGRLNVRGKLQGTLDKPEVNLAVQAADIHYQNLPIDSLQAQIRFADHKLVVDDLTISGGYSIADSTPLPFNIPGFSASLSYRGSLQGTINNPRGEISLELQNPAYKTIQFDEGRAVIHVDNHKVSLETFELIRDSLRLKSAGWFDLNDYAGDCQFTLLNEGEDSLISASVDFRLAGLNRLSAHTVLSSPDLGLLHGYSSYIPTIGGALWVDLQTNGLPKEPSGELVFHWVQPSLGAAEADSITGRLLLDRQAIKVDSLKFFKENYHSWFKTELGLVRDENNRPIISRASEVRGEAHGENFDLAYISPFLPPGMTINGISSYDLTWGGTIALPGPEGRIVIENGRVRWRETAPEIRDLTLNVAIQPDALQIERLEGWLGDLPFRLGGSVTSPDLRQFGLDIDLALSDIGSLRIKGSLSRDTIQLSAKARQVDLQTVQPFLPFFTNLEGSLSTEIDISGSPLYPQLDGFLEICGLALQPPPLLQPVTQGIIKLHFDRNSVWIDSVFAHLADGTVFVQGELTHSEQAIESVDLRAAVRSVELSRPKTFSLSIKSADLTYRGEAENYHLDGDVVLGKSKILVNFQPQALLPFAQSVERPSPDLPEFLAKTQLDVRLRDSREVWIDNNVARLRLHPEIGVIGSPARPNLAGRVTVEDGYVLFLDRKFKMTGGVIDFVDPERINPIVDIQAETTVRNYRALEPTPYDVSLSIAGPLDQVEVELTCDPPLEQPDIVSLLTLGATREQLTGKSIEGEEPSKTAILVERAGELSSQKISGYLTRNLTTLTGLDEVSIEGNLFRFGQSWGPRLVASKKINDRMAVTYMTNVGHFNEKSIRIDYRLSKYFWIESETDQRGRAGLDLKYGISFK